MYLTQKNPAPWRSQRKVIWPLPPSFAPALSRPWPFLPCLPFRFIAPSVDLPVDSRAAQSILLPNRRDASSILTRVKGGGSEDACFIVVINKECTRITRIEPHLISSFGQERSLCSLRRAPFTMARSAFQVSGIACLFSGWGGERKLFVCSKWEWSRKIDQS